MSLESSRGALMQGVVSVARACFLGGVLMLPLQDMAIASLAGHGLLLADLLFALAIGLRGLAWLAGRTPLRLQPIHIGWLAYLAALGAACAVSPDIASSLGKWVGVLYLVLLAALALDLASDAGFARRLVLTFVAAGLVAAGFALVAVVGFYLSPGHPWLAPLLSHYGSLPPGPYPRVNSLFANANMMCNFLVVAASLLLAAIRLGWLPSRAGRVGLLVIVLAALPTLSPGLGGLILALGTWHAWTAWMRSPTAARLMLLTSAGTALLILLAVAGVNLAGAGEPSVRWMIWRDVWQTWLQNPWLGAGLGQDVAGVAFTTPSGDEQWLTDAHNTWLNLAGQAGLAGVLAMLLVCVLLLRGSWPRAEEAGSAGTLRVACGIAFVSAFLYQGMAGSFEDARHLWVLMGLLAAQPYFRDSRDTSSNACAGVL